MTSLTTCEVQSGIRPAAGEEMANSSADQRLVEGLPAARRLLAAWACARVPLVARPCGHCSPRPRHGAIWGLTPPVVPPTRRGRHGRTPPQGHRRARDQPRHDLRDSRGSPTPSRSGSAASSTARRYVWSPKVRDVARTTIVRWRAVDGSHNVKSRGANWSYFRSIPARDLRRRGPSTAEGPSATTARSTAAS